MRLAVVLGSLLAFAAQARPITLTAKDGVRIYGSYVAPPKASAKPLIVLFHQAHANKSEYAPVQPRLRALGFGSLSIDQRAGGDMFGAHNRTAEAFKDPVRYDEAMPDLEAALAFAAKHSPHHRVIVWGSSYSAALVFPLAAAHPDAIAAVLAFSPGEYFLDKHEIRTAAASVRAPIFVASAPDPEEVSQAKAILAAAPATTKVQFVPKVGVHGASILRSDRDPAGAADAWKAVTAFLAGLK